MAFHSFGHSKISNLHPSLLKINYTLPPYLTTTFYTLPDNHLLYFLRSFRNVILNHVPYLIRDLSESHLLYLIHILWINTLSRSCNGLTLQSKRPRPLYNFCTIFHILWIFLNDMCLSCHLPLKTKSTICGLNIFVKS